MFPKIEEIKKKRLMLGLTQSKLSKLAGVSQSVITKIENGTVNPSYDIVTKIFKTLNQLEDKLSKKARDIMTTSFISINSKELLLNATKKMEVNAFSQLPVVNDDGLCIGNISDQIVLKLVLRTIGDKEAMELLAKKTVHEIMGEPFPTVTAQTPLKVLSSILEYASAVLVNEDAEIAGIITRSDLFKIISS